jgi:hypothetical protein
MLPGGLERVNKVAWRMYKFSSYLVLSLLHRSRRIAVMFIVLNNRDIRQTNMIK